MVMLHEVAKEQKERIAGTLWLVGAKNMNSPMNSILKGRPKHAESMLQLRPWVQYMISYQPDEGILLKNYWRGVDTELFSSDTEQVNSVAEQIPSS